MPSSFFITETVFLSPFTLNVIGQPLTISPSQETENYKNKQLATGNKDNVRFRKATSQRPQSVGLTELWRLWLLGQALLSSTELKRSPILLSILLTHIH